MNIPAGNILKIILEYCSTPDVVNAFFFNIDKIGIIKNTFIDNAADKKSYSIQENHGTFAFG